MKYFESVTPESVGIPSSSITAFIQTLREYQLCMHSVLIFKNGRLAAEGYAPPFDRDRKHRMYSISKSFTALGIGLLVGDGKLGLDDKIVDFYPEYAPGPVHPLIAAATVKDMLTMRDCHDTTLSELADWFTVPPSHPAGTIFMYNTTNTNLLCGIVEKITGKTLMEFLYPRLLAPIGFSPGCECIKGHWGHSWSGSGILCTPRDLSRLALCLMNGGRWDGRQLIGESFVKEATSKIVDTSIGREELEHWQGYGYQIWRTRNNGFGFFGMGTQLAVALPDKDMLLVTTADTQGVAADSNNVLGAFWRTVYAQSADAPLPEDKKAQSELSQTLGDMALLTSPGGPRSPVMADISGKTYKMMFNKCGWTDARFEFESGGGRMVYTNGRGVKTIPFKFGENVKFDFPETHYPGMELKQPYGKGYESYASAGWLDDETLSIHCWLADDYCGSLRVNAHFKDGCATIYLKKAAEFFLDDYQGWMYGYCQEVQV